MSLRRTKTDKVDAQAIAQMVKEKGDSLQTYSTSLYHMEELKSLTRYRLKLVGEQSKLRVSVSRLVTILFPELESLVSSLHLASIQALLIEWPGHQQLANCSLKRLTNLLKKHSRGQFGKPAGCPAVDWKGFAFQITGTSADPQKSGLCTAGS